ncbi:Methionine synthase, vitamin-B12 independent, putative [[Actinomadura] parvosata subsp. kistnae]|uniref:Methionine synthase n=1 Tax=[Actinomadura] parvosata subsp. kistnae TaxID=1909395 RepID=A0A1V0AFY6_9ACTN|nr:methionine synthase [Nonomuraea sp. ATCC 55076]AQZ69089.1 methionine synthase [Nonomuraea sp. ATCC 55076]SPL92330.1 Methionine synthase, vitamin-B12 independent, putative [Actinomadura parvosata subsp. kistnae]
MSTWEATGVGSHPGEDHLEAIRVVFGEVPGLPYLPELPARGVGADMVGRTAALLIDLPVEVQPSGWRLSDRPGRDHQRAVDHLRRDLDGLEEVAHDYEGPLKLQVCGPWTLAGSIELKFGDKMLSDAGAVRDLTASLAQGVADHCAEVRRRLPGVTEIVLQLDEPGLPGVLAGTVPTASGFGRLAAVEEWRVEESLRSFERPVVHCCAPGVPYALLRRAGVRAVSVDAALLRRRDDDALGELFEAGTTLFMGVVPGTDTRLPDPGVVAKPALELWRRLGFAPDRLSEQVVLTPACGLAGASPRYARAALAAVRKAAQVLRDDPREG